MNPKSLRTRTLARTVFVLFVPVALISWYVVSSLAAGCGTVQLAGNPFAVNVGVAPRLMAYGDFNHDNKTDIAVANFGSGQGASDGSISVLLNNGAGGFAAPTSITSGVNPRSIVSGDFNKDNNPDLAVLHYVSGSCCISTFATVFLGNAAGSFVPAGAPFAVGNDAAALAVGDFNKDTNPDLIVALPTSGVTFLLGNGMGGFGSPQTFSGVGSPQFLAVGDLNGDTKLDVIVGSTFGSNLSVLLGDGLGGFNAPINSTTGAFQVYLALGDFNEDSKLDVATATTGNSIKVLLGNGDGSFGAPSMFTVDAAPRSLVAQDLNGDGHLDLVSPSSGFGTISVLLGNGLGSFSSLKSYVAGDGSFFTVASDVTGDAKVDLVVANAGANNLSVLPGDGLGGFAGARVFLAGLSPLKIAGGDLNSDGKNDLVIANSGDQAVSVLLNAGNGSFASKTNFSLNGPPRDVVAQDFNGDGKLDLAVATSFTADVLIGNGNGGFGAATTVLNNTNGWAVTSADFNKDGKADLAVADNAAATVLILLGNGAGGFGSPTNINLTGFPTDIASGDLNGDGNADLVVANGAVTILPGDGTGGFSAGTSLPAPGAFSVALDDVNGDGFADVLTSDPPPNRLSLFLGNGNGGFGGEMMLPVNAPDHVAFADFNGDGKTDVAASSLTAGLVIFPGDGSGTFGSTVSFPAGSTPRGVLPIELDGDGRIDVAIANATGYVAVLSNTCGAAPAVVPSLSISDVTLMEGNSGQTNALFTASLSAASSQTVTVSYYSSSLTATGGSDYQSVSGRLTFPPGLTAQTVSVPINGDTQPEPDETFNVFLFSAINAGIDKGKGTGTILNDDFTQISFSTANFTIAENGGRLDVVVLRFGDLSGATMVDYATSDTAGSNACNAVTGAASSRCDYLRALGKLSFGSGESSKTISIPIIDDAFVEGAETFSITLSSVVGGTLGLANATLTINDNDSSPGSNPIDEATFFVRQHYLDFLNREPDTAGLNFWKNEITSCGSDTQCIEVKRINVSAAFFLSIEFQETGYLVYRIYKSGFGDLPGTTVPVRFIDFLRDTQQIGQGVVVGMGNWEAQLEANKQAYALAFVQRGDFQAAFPNSLTAQQFIDQLDANAGGVLSAAEKATLLVVLGATPSDPAKRASVLRAVAEDATLRDAEFNKAFVLMQYFGYMRRNPNDPPDADFAGFNFWLAKLTQFNGNFVQAEMVKAFIISAEYRQRFGP